MVPKMPKGSEQVLKEYIPPLILPLQKVAWLELELLSIVLEEVGMAVLTADVDVAKQSTVVDKVVSDGIRLAAFSSAVDTELNYTVALLVEEGIAKEEVP